VVNSDADATRQLLFIEETREHDRKASGERASLAFLEAKRC